MSELSEIFKGETLPDYVEAPVVSVVGLNNAILFNLQQGPIKEHGVNGCQVDDMIWAALTILRSFNKRFPCRENSIAITKLEEALHRLADRTRDREKRGVEGTNTE